MKFSAVFVLLFCFSSLFGQNGKEEELELSSKPANLYGTILVPESHKGVIALIIPGSGPTDRNGNSSIAGENNSLKFLAEDLAKNGIASLRIDKRGVGKSINAMKSEKDLTFDTYINDVIDWGFKILNDVRFKKLIVIGHSEGSLVGMSALEELESQLDIRAYISLAGGGFPIDKILSSQLKSLPDSSYKKAINILNQFKEGEKVENVSLDLFFIFRPSIQAYMISWIDKNPTEIIKKIKTPILIINGTNDLQVGVENAESLHDSNPKSELAIIKNLNHVLKSVEGGLEENKKTYSDPTMQNSPELIEVIIKFLNDNP